MDRTSPNLALEFAFAGLVSAWPRCSDRLLIDETRMTAGSNGRVLVSFADALSAPEVVWSLHQGGFEVLACARRGSNPALRRSRFVKLHFIADPAGRLVDALDDLEELAARLASPILMPLDDASMWLMQELAKRAPVRIAGPIGSQAAVTVDKRMQIAAAAAAGFLVPPTTEIRSVDEIARVSGYPVIVKPALAARVVAGRLGRGARSRSRASPRPPPSIP